MSKRGRTLSFQIDFCEMENFMIQRGYEVVLMSKILKDYGLSVKEAVEKYHTTYSIFDYKLVFKPEEKEEVYIKFINTLNDREKELSNKSKDYKYKYSRLCSGLYFWLVDTFNNRYKGIYNFILHVRAESILKDEFYKILYGNDNSSKND